MPKSIQNATPIMLSFVVILAIALFTSPSSPSEPIPTPTSAQASTQSEPSSTSEDKTNIKPRTDPSQANSNKATSSKPNNTNSTGRNISGSTKTEDKIITKDGRAYPLRVYKTMLTPNDPSYNQWWVAQNGMQAVWDIPAGPSEVKIAVIDTGFALNHQELSGRWAINNGESGVAIAENPSKLNCSDQSLPLNMSCNNIDDNYDGIVDNESGATTSQNPSRLNCTDQSLPLDKSCNNIDDDDNGLIDDYRGYDFSNFDANPMAGEINPTGSGTTHGTRVAGVLGATGNNTVGIAGVNWHAKILPLQAIDDNGYGDSYTVGEAIYYAADQGADIISLSLGTGSTDPYLRTAILYALDKGSIIVAASGNDGCNCISYPANYPEVIAVGAIAPDGNPAAFSNYGSELDILAPGQSMMAPTYSSVNQTSAYSTSSGTSFATPFVAGIIGLARSSQPSATWEEITGALFENSDRRTLTLTSPRSNTLGFGVSMASDMLSRLRSPYDVVQRYQFSGGTITGSTRSYQCESGVIPATRYYELKKSGIYRYTSNLRELSKYQQLGWSSRSVAYVCMGLPTDNIDILRNIDIPSETLNIKLKQ